jgi:cell division protein FtsQ
VAARYQLIGNMLAQIELRVSELRLNERRAWQVQLHNGLQLVLGRAVNDAQLEKFVAVYQQLLSDRAAQMESVDLRYNNGFAVRWKPGA